MPTSQHFQLNEVVQLIKSTNPQKLLDIGVGFGKYGFLSREYLELWDGRDKYDDWKRRIDGIEAFERYITPAHKFIYDNIYLGNAIDLLPTLDEKYDLILLIDVLEHFNFEDGSAILQECGVRGRNILISAPNDIGHQDESFENPYETHRFQWRKEHFDKFDNSFILPDVGGSMIVYLGEDSKHVYSSWKKREADPLGNFLKR